jgi:hypothetical protein
MPQSIIAPGTRIELRDEEWLVRRVDLTTSGGQQLTCMGLSELVKDKEAIFLTELDQNSTFRTAINILKPEDTEFVQDQSDGFIDSRVFNGNSLIGARRQVFGPDVLNKSKKEQLWFNQTPSRLNPLSLNAEQNQQNVGWAKQSVPINAVEPNDGHGVAFAHPTGVGIEGDLKTDHNNQPLLDERGKRIYHFLLPDPGMAHYQDKVVKGLAADAIKHINSWRTAFNKPFTDAEIKQLQIFSGKIDELWQAHTREQARIRDKTTDPFNIWGQPEDQRHQPSPLAQKDRIIAQERQSKDLKNSSPYRRLKLVMDYIGVPYGFGRSIRLNCCRTVVSIFSILTGCSWAARWSRLPNWGKRRNCSPIPCRNNSPWILMTASGNWILKKSCAKTRA